MNTAQERIVIDNRQPRQIQTVEYENDSAPNVLGVCGREGAGKTTIANMLTGLPEYELRPITSPIDYICNILFGSFSAQKDPIWNMSRDEQQQFVEQMIKKYVPAWFDNNPKGIYMAPFLIQNSASEWVEFSLATPLKCICSIIYGLPFDILMAQTPETRTERELVQSRYTDANGAPLNGRTCLEYFGTDVMRNNFDKDIWLKILKRDATWMITSGYRVIIPDVRFENEVDLINEMGGALMVVYREWKDLEITDADRKSHPAKWHFLEYYKNAKKLKFVSNHGDISLLKKSVFNYL
jgi:energy-coupling factor transporter ATP-binding protein EcfA2